MAASNSDWIMQDLCFKVNRLQGHGAARFGIGGYHRGEVWDRFTAALGPIDSLVLPHRTLGLPA